MLDGKAHLVSRYHPVAVLIEGVHCIHPSPHLILWYLVLGTEHLDCLVNLCCLLLQCVLRLH